MNPKRVLAIHDLSGVGRCSLTVALPILSVCGLEACALPTAVLSTHTGGFSHYTYRDLTNDMEAMAAHWQSLGLHFDAVYSGYLGSQQQLSILSDLLRGYRLQNSLVLLDPVMADEGKLYTHFNTEFVNGMRSLCSYADIIVPNMTEASLLLNIPYKEPPYSPDYICCITHSLYELCHASIVLTGVTFGDGKLGVAVYDSLSETFSLCLNQMIEGVYYGTGDVFASALLGAYLKNADLTAAAQIAVDFTLNCIIRTKKSGADPHYGVQFEPELHSLITKLAQR